MTEEYFKEVQRKFSTKPFICKLWNMIMYENYIEWGPDDNSFVITNTNNFILNILPKYFKSNNLNSFQRNLNYWGFTYYNKSTFKYYYTHPHFKKDILGIVSKIVRKSNHTVIKYNKRKYESSSELIDSDVNIKSNTASNNNTTLSKKDQNKNRNLRFAKRQMISKKLSTNNSITKSDNTINMNKLLLHNYIDDQSASDMMLNQILLEPYNTTLLPTIREITNHFENNCVKQFNISITMDEIDSLVWD